MQETKTRPDRRNDGPSKSRRRGTSDVWNTGHVNARCAVRRLRFDERKIDGDCSVR
jgi:hypothetical protein